MAKKVNVIRKKLVEHNLDAILFTDLNNVRYLSGFSGSNGQVLITRNNSVLLTDGRYTAQANEETKDFEILIYKGISKGIIDSINEKTVKNIGVEDDDMSLKMHNLISKGLTGSTLVPVSNHLEGLRSIKSDDEIKYLRKATRISERALKKTREIIRPGIKEKDIAAELNYMMDKFGGQGLSFDTIVVSGKRGGLPHGKPSNKKLKVGEFITIDFGCVYQGYHADQTVTYALGSMDDLSEEQKTIYGLVEKAQRAAIKKVKPRVKFGTIDYAAREVIKDGGYGPEFMHSTGHGVGLQIHEEPYIAENMKGRLNKNMVFSVEPGIYLPGRYGVRLEDIVLVTGDGYKKVTHISKKLKDNLI